MDKDFNSEFDQIINNNNFQEPQLDTPQEQQLSIALDEALHVLEVINETSMIIAGIIGSSMEKKDPMQIPNAAVTIFKALHTLSEEFCHIMTEEDCDCEECQNLNGEED